MRRPQIEPSCNPAAMPSADFHSRAEAVETQLAKLALERGERDAQTRRLTAALAARGVIPTAPKPSSNDAERGAGGAERVRARSQGR